MPDTRKYIITMAKIRKTKVFKLKTAFFLAFKISCTEDVSLSMLILKKSMFFHKKSIVKFPACFAIVFYKQKMLYGFSYYDNIAAK